jgi:protein involved in polysaccharide export with SLBB domain
VAVTAESNGFFSVLVVVACMFFCVCTARGQGFQSSQRLLSDPTSTAKEPAGKQPALQRRELRYRVHPTDTLELTFPLTPEFDQVVTVQPDGFVSLRGLGGLAVAGQTLPELTASLTKAYSVILKEPMIYVNPKDYERPYFIVGGQVGKPGKFDWRGDVTVTQAIAIAGGFTDAAKHSQVVLFRRVSDQWAQSKLINVKHMLNARNLSEDPMLQPGDMLYVPKNTISKIKPFIPLPSVGMYANQF